MKRLLLMASLCIGMIFVSTTTAQITWNKTLKGAGLGCAYGANKYVTMRSGTSSSTDLVTWTIRLASIYPRFLYGVTYNSGFVVVGDSGTIYSSPDGITWTKRTSGTVYTLRGIGHSSNLFIAVGDSGTILTSPDGTTWTKRTSGTTKTLVGVTYGKGQFVIGGGGGIILTSPDGITWTKRMDGAIWSFLALSFGSNMFVACGTPSPTSHAIVYISRDGITWTDRTGCGVTSNYDCTSITYGAGYFVIVSKNGWIFASSDTGNVWVPTGYNLGELDCVIYANNMFIACGDHLYTSPAVNAIRYTAPKASANQLLTITNNTARFTLKQAANTSLTLFDLSGKAIAKLINGQKAAGTYSTALPSMLPQGRCVLSLKAGEASCVTPVMIMR